MFNKTLDQGQAGDNVGVLLRGIEPRGKSSRGQVLAKPGSITPHTKFEAEVYVLSKEEGGRHTPFFSGYRPQFYFRTTDVTGSAALLGGAEMCMPGDNVKLSVELITPIAMDDGVRFAIREGGRTVAGSGVVTKIPCLSEAGEVLGRSWSCRSVRWIRRCRIRRCGAVRENRLKVFRSRKRKGAVKAANVVSLVCRGSRFFLTGV